MKLQLFNIDFSEFTEGKKIDKVSILDYTLDNQSYCFFAAYFPIINQLTIIKCLPSSTIDMMENLSDNQYAIFYTLND